ncbi:MAG: carboxypeptidase regulatory-like domain-containing protein [Deltaproteobacteria bacterium]|nr:carboxypeptidase regulatory-like domain-containing protein [Deltaproteobacteria bacterium]
MKNRRALVLATSIFLLLCLVTCVSLFSSNDDMSLQKMENDLSQKVEVLRNREESQAEPFSTDFSSHAISVELSPYGHISIQFRDEMKGQPVSGVGVKLTDEMLNPITRAVLSDDQGCVGFKGVYPGSYRWQVVTEQMLTLSPEPEPLFESEATHSGQGVLWKSKPDYMQTATYSGTFEVKAGGRYDFESIVYTESAISGELPQPMQGVKQVWNQVAIARSESFDAVTGSPGHQRIFERGISTGYFEDGRFHFKGLEPGEYFIRAWWHVSDDQICVARYQVELRGFEHRQLGILQPGVYSDQGSFNCAASLSLELRIPEEALLEPDDGCSVLLNAVLAKDGRALELGSLKVAHLMTSRNHFLIKPNRPIMIFGLPSVYYTVSVTSQIATKPGVNVELKKPKEFPQVDLHSYNNQVTVIEYQLPPKRVIVKILFSGSVLGSQLHYVICAGREVIANDVGVVGSREEVPLVLGERYQVVAFSDKEAHVSEFTAEDEFVSLSMITQAELTGRIVKPDGTPLRNAEIGIRPALFEGINPYTIRTDQEGKFALKGLAPGIELKSDFLKGEIYPAEGKRLVLNNRGVRFLAQ